MINAVAKCALHLFTIFVNGISASTSFPTFSTLEIGHRKLCNIFGNWISPETRHRIEMWLAGLSLATLKTFSLRFPTFLKRAFEAMAFDTYGPETAFCETVAEVKVLI